MSFKSWTSDTRVEFGRGFELRQRKFKKSHSDFLGKTGNPCGVRLNTTRVSNFFIGTRVVSYSESLALQGFPLFINNPDAS